MKKFITFLLLTAVIGAGIGYAIYQDPEREVHGLFNQAIQKFSQHTTLIEAQYRKDNSLLALNESYTIDYGASSININIYQENGGYTIKFGDGEELLAQKTVILKPQPNNTAFIWKCIEGSLITRLRSKECRIGTGIIFNKN